MAHTLDVEDALVAPLAGLGLRQVPGLQGDGLHLAGGDQDLLGADQLGTVLRTTVRGDQREDAGRCVKSALASADSSF